MRTAGSTIAGYLAGTQDALLLEYYDKTIGTVLVQDEEILALAEEVKEIDYEGSVVRCLIKVGRSPAHGALPADAITTIPTSKTREIKTTAAAKELYGSIGLTEREFRSARSTKYAFESAVDREVGGMVEGMKRGLARQLWGNDAGLTGTSRMPGILARVSAIDTDTLTLTNPGARFLDVGDRVVGISVSAGSTAAQSGGTPSVESGAYGEIVSVDYEAFSITLGSGEGGDFSVGDYLVWGHGADASLIGANNEVTGIDFIAADDNLYDVFGIDTSANPKWKPWSYNVGAARTNPGTLKSTHMTSLCSALAQRAGDRQRPNLILTHEGCANEIAGLMQAGIRYQPVKLTGGVDIDGTKWVNGRDEVPMLIGIDAEYNTITFTRKDALEKIKLGEPGWQQKDGGVWYHSASSGYAWQSNYVMMLDLFTRSRNRYGQLKFVKANEASMPHGRNYA